MVAERGGPERRHSALQRNALAWLMTGALSASCGGRSTEVHRRDGNDGASGSAGTSPHSSSHAGTSNASGRGAGGGVNSSGTGGSHSGGASVTAGGTARGGHGGSAGSSAGAFGSGGNAGLNGSAGFGGSAGSSGSKGGRASGGTAGSATNAGSGGDSRGGVGNVAGFGGAEFGGGGVGASGGRPFSITGGDSVGPGGDAGASGLPAPPAGGITVQLSPPAPPVGSRMCLAGTTGAFTYTIGDPGQQQVIASGYDGTVVDCTLTQEGPYLLFQASITGTDANGHEPMAFSISGVIEYSSASTNQTWFSPDTGHLMELSTLPGCTLSAITRLGSDGLAADLDCGVLGAQDDDTNGCKVHGTFAFLDCATGG